MGFIRPQDRKDLAARQSGGLVVSRSNSTGGHLMYGTLAMRRKSKAKASLQADPTPQRMAKAGGHFEFGDDRQGSKVLTMRDSPLERLRLRKTAAGQWKITEAQYNAGIK